MRLPEANNKSRIPKNKYIPTSVLSSISTVSLIPESYFFALFCFFYKLDTNLRFPNHLNKPNDFIIIFEFLRNFKSNQRREIYYRSLPLSLLVEENFHAWIIFQDNHINLLYIPHRMLFNKDMQYILEIIESAVVVDAFWSYVCS